MSKFTNIGGLWLSDYKDSHGNPQYTGEVTVNGEKVKIQMFRNTKKSEKKHPEFNLCVKNVEQAKPADQPTNGDEDIPF